MRRDKVVSRIARSIKKYAPEAEAILYGSEARGDARSDSDIDLLILLPDSYTGKDFVKRRSHISGHLYDISVDTGIDISSLILPRNIWLQRKSPFTVNVANDGIRL